MSPDQKAEARERQKGIALALKEKHGKTQAEIAVLLGVGQQTVSDWLRVIPNTGSGKRNKSAKGKSKAKPSKKKDRRVKVSGEEEREIYKRALNKESQAQIAADYGIAQSQVSKIVGKIVKEMARERDLRRQKRAIAEGIVETHNGPFDVIAYDPPWPYGTRV